MDRHSIELDKEYLLEYPRTNGKPKNTIVKVVYIDLMGDCQIKFKNGKKDTYHCSWLKEK